MRMLQRGGALRRTPAEARPSWIECCGGVEKHRVVLVAIRVKPRLHCSSRSGLWRGTRSTLVADLATEAVQGAVLALERVDDIQGRHGLTACVLRVGDRVADDIL